MDSFRVYQYSSPIRLIFGPGALDELKREIGPKEVPLITTDKGIARSGVLERVTAVLEAGAIRYEVFDGVEPDPSVEVIEEASDIYRRRGCTALIGLGGGSSIDTAKAVCVGGTQEGYLLDYALGGKPLVGEIPPFYAIPTTVGTGSEVTAVAVVSDEKNKVKTGIRSPMLAAKVAILDPLLVSSLPSKVVGETAADALSHAIEAYVGRGSNAVTDALAIAAIGMISRDAVNLVKDSGNVEAAGNMLIASCMAGMAFNNAGIGLVHAMAHPLGAYYHVPHGLACALYLPVVMEFNAVACPEKLASIAHAAGEALAGLKGEEAAKRGVAAVQSLLKRMGLPEKLSSMGIQFRLEPKMVDDVLAFPPGKNNPRPFDAEQVARLLEAAA